MSDLTRGIFSLLWSFFLVAGFTVSGGLSAIPRPVAVLVCYDFNAFIREQCEALETKLKACKQNPICLHSPSPAAIEARLKRETLPSHIPVLVVGHGENFRDSSKNLKNYLQVQPKVSVADKTGLVETSAVIRALGNSLSQPSVWINTCYSGQLCFEGVQGCVGMSCRSFQPIYGRQDKNGRAYEATTDALTDILCSDAVFDQVDAILPGKKNGVINPEKLWAYFCRRFGSEKIIEMPRAKNVDRQIAKVRSEFEVEKVEERTERRGVERIPYLVFTLKKPVPCSTFYATNLGREVTQYPQPGTFILYSSAKRVAELQPDERHGAQQGDKPSH